jgi:hypothetical protein
VKMPPELTYALQHRRWGALPEAGGLRDQPAGMLSKMAHLSAVYSGIKAYYDAANAASWADANPDLWELVSHARKLYNEWLRKS